MPRKPVRDLFIDRRVAVDPVPLASKKKGTIMYRGLLASSGADSVYLYAGYGDAWENARFTPMQKVDETTWSAELMVEGDRKLNFCFKDGADHWDNNSGLNWAIEIV